MSNSVLLIIGLIAGAIAGGLVDYLLGLILPEKVRVKHLVSIIIVIVVFSFIAVSFSNEDVQSAATDKTPIINNSNEQLNEIADQSTLTPEPTQTGKPLNSQQQITFQNISSVTELRRIGKGNINKIAFSPDDKFLGVATTTGLFIFDSSDLSMVKQFGDRRWYSSIAFSPNNDFIVSGDYGGKIELWSLDGSHLRTLSTTSNYIYSIAISSDAEWVAGLNSKDKIIVVSINESSIIAELDTNSTGGVIHFSPDSTMLVHGDYDGLRIWSTISWQITQELGNARWVQEFEFFPNSTDIIVGNTNSELSTWNINSANSIDLLDDGSNSAQFIDIAVHPDGKRVIVSRGELGNVEYWEIATKEKQSIPQLTNINQLEFTSDGSLLATTSFDGLINLWRTDNWSQVGIAHGYWSFENVYPLTVDTVFADTSGTLAVEVNYRTGEIVRTFNCAGRCFVSPSGNTYLSRDIQGVINVYSIESEARLFTFTSQRDWWGTAAFSNTDSFLAAGGSSGNISLWNLNSGEIVHQFTHDLSCWIRDLDFNDQETLLVAGSDCGIFIWNISSGELVYHFGEFVRTVTFNQSGTLLAAEGGMWDMVDGKMLFRIGDGIVADIAFNPDENILAYSGQPVIKIVDRESGDELARLAGHTLWSRQVMFNSTGEYLISSSDDGTILVWGIP